MSRFATRTVVEFRGSARRNEVTGIEDFMTRNTFIGSFRIQQTPGTQDTPGMLVVDADVLARDVGEASEMASKILRAAMAAANWNRMNELWRIDVMWPRESSYAA